MDISRELAIKILKYKNLHKDFYIPFLIVCKEYPPEDNDFVEIEPCEWHTIMEDENYKTFQLWENLQNIDEMTLKLMSKGFIEKATKVSLELKIEELSKNYRSEWKENLWESEEIEEYGFNEFIGGKAEGYEDCLNIIKKYNE